MEGGSGREEEGGREEGGLHTSLRDPLSSSCVTINDEFLSWKHDMSWYDARTAGHESALPSKKRKRCPLMSVSESTVICPPCLLNVKAPRYMSLYRLRRCLGEASRFHPRRHVRLALSFVQRCVNFHPSLGRVLRPRIPEGCFNP